MFIIINEYVHIEANENNEEITYESKLFLNIKLHNFLGLCPKTRKRWTFNPVRYNLGSSVTLARFGRGVHRN